MGYCEVGQAVDAVQGLVRVAKFMNNDGLADVVKLNAIEVEKTKK